MKKLLCAVLCLATLITLAVPAMAAGMQVCFTSDSRVEVGGTVTVDRTKTFESVMSDGSCTSDIYNAFLEGQVIYCWFRDGEYYSDGDSVTFTNDDEWCEFYCRAYAFSDADCTQQCGFVDSAVITVPRNAIPDPVITTKNLEDATLGEYYYKKLECTDPDATFSLYRSSLPDGMYLTQHGEIEGTPTEAGMFYLVIKTVGAGGDSYVEFEFTVVDGPQNFIEIVQLPKKLEYTAGEKLDMTGLRVRIYTPDGYIDSKDGERLTYSDKALVTVGEQKIKLTYEDAFEFFIVTVKAAPEDATDPADGTDVTTEPTEEEKDSGKKDTKRPKSSKNDDDEDKEKDDLNETGGIPIWAVLAIMVVAAGAGVGITVAVIGRKKK